MGVKASMSFLYKAIKPFSSTTINRFNKTILGKDPWNRQEALNLSWNGSDGDLIPMPPALQKMVSENADLIKEGHKWVSPYSWHLIPSSNTINVDIYPVTEAQAYWISDNIKTQLIHVSSRIDTFSYAAALSHAFIIIDESGHIVQHIRDNGCNVLWGGPVPAIHIDNINTVSDMARCRFLSQFEQTSIRYQDMLCHHSHLYIGPLGIIFLTLIDLRGSGLIAEELTGNTPTLTQSMSDALSKVHPEKEYVNHQVLPWIQAYLECADNAEIVT